MNILICENHKLIAMDLEDMLSAQGHTVEGTVDSACDCLERCASNPPDLVLTNLNLTDGATGFGLADALAKQGIPTVIVSSDTGSVPAGTPARAVVKKPVHECELEIAVGRLG